MGAGVSFLSCMFGVGSVFGVRLMKILREVGQVDLIISLSYVVFLGIIGSLMLVESLASSEKTPARSHSFLLPTT